MRTSTLFGAKNFGFFEIMVCPHGQGGKEVEPVRTRGSIFRDFLRTSFMVCYLLLLAIDLKQVMFSSYISAWVYCSNYAESSSISITIHIRWNVYSLFI